MPDKNNPEEAGKLFVGGLSWETTQENLHQYFSRFGEVIDCVVMKNSDSGRSRGFGFVTFKDPNCVSIVLSSGPHELDNRTIDPKACNPRGLQKSVTKVKKGTNSLPKVFLGGLPSSCTETDIRSHFTKYGKVAEVVIMYDQEQKKSRGFGFLSFENEDSVDRVCAEHYVNINGKQVECKKAEPRDGESKSSKNNNNQNQGPPQNEWGNNNMQMGGPPSGWGPGPQGMPSGPGMGPMQNGMMGYQGWGNPQQQGPYPGGYGGYQGWGNTGGGYGYGAGAPYGQGYSGYGPPAGYGGYGGYNAPMGNAPPPAGGPAGANPAESYNAQAAGNAPNQGQPAPNAQQMPGQKPDYNYNNANYGTMGNYAQDSSSYGPSRGYGMQGNFPGNAAPTPAAGAGVGGDGFGGNGQNNQNFGRNQNYHPYRR